MISNQISEKLDKAAPDYNIAGLDMTRFHPRKSRKRRLRRAMKSPPKGKAARAVIARAKF